MLTDSGQILDARARQESRTRLLELRSDLDEASQWADLGRADSLRREIEFITSQLTSSIGRSGQARKLGDPMERMRKAVTNRIHDAIARMSKQDASLGRHLANAIRTGFYCWYSPETYISWKS